MHTFFFSFFFFLIKDSAKDTCQQPDKGVNVARSGEPGCSTVLL